MSSDDREALRRVKEAAYILSSAIRLGADPVNARHAMESAVAEGAEDLRLDTLEAYKAARPSAAAAGEERETR